MAAAEIHSASATLAYVDIFPSTAPPPTAADLAPDWVEMISHPETSVFVAEQDGVTVGAVALTPNSNLHPAPNLNPGSNPNLNSGDEPDEGLLLARLYVHPDHWGRGHGAALHHHAVAVALTRTSVLYLWVLEHNTRARQMYEAWGWELVPDRFLANDPPEIRDVLYCLGREQQPE
jgi:GNAT superfamily N-acetyltransferase